MKEKRESRNNLTVFCRANWGTKCHQQHTVHSSPASWVGPFRACSQRWWLHPSTLLRHVCRPAYICLVRTRSTWRKSRRLLAILWCWFTKRKGWRGSCVDGSLALARYFLQFFLFPALFLLPLLSFSFFSFSLLIFGIGWTSLRNHDLLIWADQIPRDPPGHEVRWLITAQHQFSVYIVSPTIQQCHLVGLPLTPHQTASSFELRKLTTIDWPQSDGDEMVFLLHLTRRSTLEITYVFVCDFGVWLT